MTCEDAPCCGCCGQIADAREAESEMEWAMEAQYDDGFGPEPYDDEEDEE